MGRPQELIEQRQTLRVGPLQVVEHEHAGLLLAEIDEQLAQFAKQ